MRLIGLVLGLGVPMLISGCSLFPKPAHYVTTEAVAYDPGVSSRIRVLSGNGTKWAAFRPGEACYAPPGEVDDRKIVVGDGFLAGWKYSSRSVLIGMPQSPRLWMTVDGLVFKDMIREYVVPASKPLAIGMSTGGSTGDIPWNCSPPWVTFTPQPGQDYDVFVNSSGRKCWVAVQRIDAHGLDEPVTVARASKCAADPNAAVQ